MEQDDLKVRIKFVGEPGSTPAGGFDISQLSRLMASAPAPVPVHAGGPVSAAGELAAEMEEKLHEVKSPIVGTFYESPSPGAPAFVKVGGPGGGGAGALYRRGDEADE